MSQGDRDFPDEVEDVVRRALAADPAERWPSVTAYVEALTDALGDGAPPAQGLAAWQTVDPELTEPGPRPSPRPTDGELDPPRPPRRRRRLVTTSLVAVLALAVGGTAGWLGFRALDRDITITDSRDELSVTVPDDWDASVANDPWTPPGEEETYAALSVGTSSGWAERDDGEGVFVGLFPDDDLPSELPGHPECGDAEEPTDDTIDGDPSRTIVYTGCPGVLVERVVQVAVNRVLWVQVRSDDRATANDVLGSVGTTSL